MEVPRGRVSMLSILLLCFVWGLHAKAAASSQQEIVIPYWECTMENVTTSSSLICQMLQPVEFKFTKILHEGDCKIENVLRCIEHETGKTAVQKLFCPQLFPR